MSKLPWALLGVGTANVSAMGLLVWLNLTDARIDVFASTSLSLTLGTTVLVALGEQKRRLDALERRLSREAPPEGTRQG